MTDFSTYLGLDNEIKINELLRNGEVLDSYSEGTDMICHFLLNDFFVTLITSELTDESTMRVSRTTDAIDQYVDAIDLDDLY